MPPVHFAVREGHLDSAKLLLDNGASIHYRSTLYGNDTLLTMALDRGHEELAAHLQARLEEETRSDGRKHVIHEAVSAGDRKRVEKLLDGDPGLSFRGDHLGRPPLHYAVEIGRRDLVDLLLDHGADVDGLGCGSDDRLGTEVFRPVALALWHHSYWRQRNDYELARHLLERGADYSITIAAALGDEARVEELLSADRSSANGRESCGKGPLSAAAERDHGSIVNSLLDAGADPNLPEGGNCPRGYALWAAARFGHRTVAMALLDASADPNAEVESSGTPTEIASDAEMRALLYRHGGTVGLPAHFAHGHIDTIACLLDQSPASFDDETIASGFTHSVSGGHEAVLRLLLSRGLRVPKVVTACQRYLWDSLPLARLLLEHEMDPDLPNWQSIRPLHHMAARGEVDKARLFLEFGADAGAVDEEYRSTPLGWAARCGQSAFVRFLLALDPAREACEVPAWAAPVEWAKRRGHREIESMLSP